MIQKSARLSELKSTYSTVVTRSKFRRLCLSADGGNCRQYSKAYVADEEAAKMAHKGIWQGQFEIPAEWRRDKKSHSRSSSTDSIVASAPAPQSAGSGALQIIPP